MNREELQQLSVSELLARTQTNVTPDAHEGLEVAQLAYARAETDLERGVAARQAGFRAEQAGETADAVQQWFDKSRRALASDEPEAKRELIATELLTGRALALRAERLGSTVMGLVTEASDAFARGEAILQEQHEPKKAWDRFGTMLARHRATHEAMNGKAGFAFMTSLRGIWRAIRASREGTPEGHRSFVVKQVGMNAVAGALAATKPLSRISVVATKRHQLARRLLG